MKKLGLIALFGLIFGLAGCRSSASKAEENVEPEIAMDFFSGEFVYFADSPTFYDCATGARYPVGSEGAYLKTERAYTAFEPKMGVRIYIEFFGRIDSLPGMEEGTIVPTVTIDSLIVLDPKQACNREFTIGGLYGGEIEDGRELLHLKTDRSFIRTRYLKDEERVTRGDWGMISTDSVVLRYRDDKGKAHYFYFQTLPAQEAIIFTEDGDQRIYNKVYI